MPSNPGPSSEPPARPPARSGGRSIAWSVAAISLIGMLFSGYALAQRIRAYHADHQRDLFYFIRTDRNEFAYEDRLITFMPELDEQGEGTVTLTSASTEDPSDTISLVMPVQVPTPINFPNLERFADWMGVFFFAHNEDRLRLDEFRALTKSGEIPVRCVVVVRVPNAGVSDEGRFSLEVDPESWGFGEVMRHRWTFRFHELKPDGTIETSERRMPESGARFYRRQVAAYKAGEEQPQRAEDELKEGTWRWDAALHIMPRAPAITKENQALLSAGWTLPASSSFTLALLLSIAFACAPERRTEAVES